MNVNVCNEETNMAKEEEEDHYEFILLPEQQQQQQHHAHLSSGTVDNHNHNNKTMANNDTPRRGRQQRRHKRKSFLYKMLNSKSNCCQAQIYKYVIATIIAADFVVYVLSTEPGLNNEDSYNFKLFFYIWNAIISHLFMVDYITRLMVVTESQKYGKLGTCKGRMKYAMTFHAIVDLISFLPYFLDVVFHNIMAVPKLSWLKSLRLVRILKTSGFVEAANIVHRVLYYNRHILYVAVLICIRMTILTAVFLYYLRPPDNYDNDHDQEGSDLTTNEFRSIASTIYITTLLLTGQGGPDPTNLPWYTKMVIFPTSVLSIGMFALPASMLTWGFAGEAERYAKLAYTHRSSTTDTNNRTGGDDDWSDSTDSYSTDEEYLKIISGYDDDDDQDQQHNTSHTIRGRNNRSMQTNTQSGSLNNDHKGFSNASASHHHQDMGGAGCDNDKDLALRATRIEQIVREQSDKLDRIIALLEVHIVPQQRDASR